MSRSALKTDTALRGGTESLVLPADFDETAYRAAVDLDQMFGRGPVADEAVQAKVMTHRDTLLHHLADIFPHRPPFSIGWPSPLYIPD